MFSREKLVSQKLTK